MTSSQARSRIYLDHNATTPVRPEVADEMSRVLRGVHGNPSSVHAEGAAARALVEEARRQVAACLGVESREVFFTAGATEANNTVLRGVAGDPSASGPLVISTTEHPSVVEPAAWLEAAGVDVRRIPVDGEGLLDLAAFEAALEDAPALVSLIWANNETGVLQPMERIAELTRERGLLLHVDATQAVGKVEVDLSAVPADFLSSSAHKLGGPKGVGCLVVREGRAVAPLLLGGPQERRWRGGTENVSGIAGFAVACDLARKELHERQVGYAALRDRLWRGIEAAVPRVRRNGHSEQVLPNTLNVEFRDTPGEVLVEALDLEGVAVSAGAACHSGSVFPSHVLAAMGRSAEEARGSVRFSVGHGVTQEQVDCVVELLGPLVERVRQSGGG
ncbi:MAG: cysteine desulfurase [Deltaproteobacteria bacterium]|nr:cysteine desulfurase [Deltaproteobacteria bacterium]